MAFRKQWRWLGAFGPDVMLCAARAAIGPARVAWWAVWDREAGVLTERTRRSWRGVTVEPERAAVAGILSVELTPGRPIEITSPHGGHEIWTRKTPVRVEGVATIGARRIEISADGLLDESAGRHALREGYGVMERHEARW